jgi:hypothetical protein
MSQYTKQPEARLCKNGCGQEIIWDNTNRYFLNVANNERHMCPNFTPRQRSQDIKQTYQPTQRPSYTPTPGRDWSGKNESIQAMHNEKTDLTKEYHTILREQNELKKRELDLLERQVKTQEWMSQVAQEEQKDFLKEGKKMDVPENLLSKGKKQNETI